ncbi:MAG TPA: hypothetical protein VE967_01155 [Gemmatimonadaceae bacterium]|nr:hypothetical protein [Gemmatimonadaceae bacterium]
MTNPLHLTEEERHMAADGSMGPEDLVVAQRHLRSCAECSADVERIRGLLDRVGQSAPSPVSTSDVNELWPAIRARIEQQKVVAMPGSAPVPARRRAIRPWGFAFGGTAAAAIAFLLFARRNEAPTVATDAVAVADSGGGAALIAVVDSTRAFEQEAQALLNHFELQRATMRPELARAFEHDLRVIDVAIAELEGAIASDPTNPALRRLLASSYRQKVDLLKRVDNAS